ncbi:MAG: hypothetical protein AMXMBFR7_33720 [Planctomycetota bacterium]
MRVGSGILLLGGALAAGALRAEAETPAAAQVSIWKRTATIEIEQTYILAALAAFSSSTKAEVYIDPRIHRLPEAKRLVSLKGQGQPLQSVLESLVKQAGLLLEMRGEKAHVSHASLPYRELLGVFEVSDLAAGDSRPKTAEELYLSAEERYGCCPHMLDKQKAADAEARSIVSRLQRAVAPGSWSEKQASAEVLRGQLAVTHRPEVLAQIRPWLDRERANRTDPLAQMPGSKAKNKKKHEDD